MDGFKFNTKNYFGLGMDEMLGSYNMWEGNAIIRADFSKGNKMNRLNDEKAELTSKINDVVNIVNRQESMFEALRTFNDSVNTHWEHLGVHQQNLIKNLMKEILDL